MTSILLAQRDLDFARLKKFDIDDSTVRPQAMLMNNSASSMSFHLNDPFGRVPSADVAVLSAVKLVDPASIKRLGSLLQIPINSYWSHVPRITLWQTDPLCSGDCPMITCDECGHVNRLGAIYCGACGAKLDVNMAVIEDSVMSTASDIRAKKVFTAGAMPLSLDSFCWCRHGFSAYFVPAMPNPQMPQSQEIKPSEMFPANVQWVQPSSTMPLASPLPT